MTWLPAPDGVLSFTRAPLTCIANLSPSPVPLPAGDLLLTSTPLTPPSGSDPSRYLPPDTTAWLRLPAS